MKKVFIVLAMLVSCYVYSDLRVSEQVKSDMLTASMRGDVTPTKSNIEFFCAAGGELSFNVLYNSLRDAIGDNADIYLSKASIYYGGGYIDIKNSYEYKLLQINDQQYSDLKENSIQVLSVKRENIDDLMSSATYFFSKYCNDNPERLIKNYNRIFK